MIKKLPQLYTALITPFKQDQSIDETALYALLNHQKKAGVPGLLALGTTAESYALSLEEKQHLLAIIANFTNQSNIDLCVNVSSNTTDGAIKMAHRAEKEGANSLLMLPPFYVKTTREGMFEHFKNVAKATSLPIIVYHHPPRTGIKLDFCQIKALSEIESIVGIKEPFTDIQTCQKLVESIPTWNIYAGDDALTLPVMSVGGRGVISVMSNIFPKTMQTLVKALDAGQLFKAQAIHKTLLPFFNTIACEPNPSVIKQMLAICMGFDPLARRPLLTLKEETKNVIKTLFAQESTKTLILEEMGEGQYA
ncbi:4-hydroxy-tetrahydrodipicolinate synthase [Candidatus Aerophobetes bacterium]|uniref:4-hydroxy-tetrahydrodipicolinate synthase n=1 Tax=Aerophobetes bacterium TaxID=2030807 RepID=A0A2A4WYS7_UNCAE|nr:MAG: 4-hydroxy-tetrahydrodipicolinate synthase [Candidatus Aerophobetes bacterium]